MTRTELLLKIKELQSLVEVEEHNNARTPGATHDFYKSKQLHANLPTEYFNKIRAASLLLKTPVQTLVADAIYNHIKLLETEHGIKLDGSKSPKRMPHQRNNHVDKELRMFKNAVKSLELKWSAIE